MTESTDEDKVELEKLRVFVTEYDRKCAEFEEKLIEARLKAAAFDKDGMQWIEHFLKWINENANKYDFPGDMLNNINAAWGSLNNDKDELPAGVISVIKIFVENVFDIGDIFGQYGGNLDALYAVDKLSKNESPHDVAMPKIAWEHAFWEAQKIAKANKFSRKPEEKRRKAKEFAHSRKRELLSKGKSSVAANYIVINELEENKEYSDIINDMGKENIKKFLQL